MTPVHDSKRNDIGKYDGRFVYDRVGTKCYWIEDGDVFSVPPLDREIEFGTRAAVKIATLVDRTAIGENGDILFTV